MSKKRVIIDITRCKSCELCVRACVRHCLGLSSERNEAGYLVIELKDPDSCTGCGGCVRTCPEPQCLWVEEIPGSFQKDVPHVLESGESMP